MKKANVVQSLVSIAVVVVLLTVLNGFLSSFQARIFNLCGIYVILALSMNLINGFVGLFSLGHAGFMAVGAYTTAMLTMSKEMKEMNFFLEPIAPWLLNVQLPFPIALIVGGLMASLAAFIIGAPVLRLNDDYLAIATLGFSEIIRVIFTNTQSLTNGALGLKGLPYIGIANKSSEAYWWIWGIVIITVVFMVVLIKSTYGRAFKAIREDEVAAEAMGINLFKHKMMAFVIGAFFAGIGGSLLGHLMGTIDPLLFRYLLTFNIVLIVVLGGIGSITGSVISAIVVTIAMEVLRILDGTIKIGSLVINGIPGTRMVVFSVLLMVVILFYQRGLMGTKEFSWSWFKKLPFITKKAKIS
ncbi:MAG: transporter permease [Clostridia bacterium]|jgi:branched-chain amino acid transport system permease protein|nr:transporter permease [Clostridia bacterium]